MDPQVSTKKMIHYALPCNVDGCSGYGWSGAEEGSTTQPVAATCLSCIQRDAEAGSMTGFQIDYMRTAEAREKGRMPRIARCCSTGTCDGSLEP